MTTDPSILKRIAGLLALSEDRAATPNEIAIAARKAQELMDRHRLTRADLDNGNADGPQLHQDEPFINQKRIPDWLMGLANVVGQHNGCFSVVYRNEATRKQQLVMIGRREDVDVARYLFTFLRREIDRVARLYQSVGAFRRRGAQQAFRIGCVTAINIEMTRAREAVAGKQGAIVLRSGFQKSVQWAEKHLPGLRVLDTEVNVDGNDRAFLAGLEEGSRMRASKAMGGGEIVPSRRMK